MTELGLTRPVPTEPNDPKPKGADRRARLVGTLDDIGSMAADDVLAMYRLMSRYYDNLPMDSFLDDLSEKQWAAVVRHSVDDSILGFSTILVDEVSTAEGPTRVLFSGDTIVDRRIRTANPLARLVLEHALAIADRDPTPLYWFLISKGYRTYRYLPLLFHSFHPRVGHPNPLREDEIINSFATKRYPASFDRETGVIAAARDGCRLHAEEAPITDARRRDPHVRFFEARNPGHARGDELCCLALVEPENLTPAGRRLMDRS